MSSYRGNDVKLSVEDIILQVRFLFFFQVRCAAVLLFGCSAVRLSVGDIILQVRPSASHVGLVWLRRN